MNEQSLAALEAFVSGRRFDRVADLGGRDFNGSVKDLIPNAVSFDIIPGEGVDVLLTPGRVQSKHYAAFDLVTVIGSLQCAPDTVAFRHEALLLLKREGYLYILTCTPACTMRHTAPEEAPDRHRFTPESLIQFLTPGFSVVSVREMGWHPVLECVARKT